MQQSLLSLIILFVVIFLFATRLMPIGITAVLGAVAMSVCGIITSEELFAGFGSDTVMLILGMIVVGNAVSETGLTDILGEKIMRLPGIAKNERFFLLVVIFIVAVLSGFLSNTATVAIFLPLIASVAKASQGRITKKNTYMAVGIASVIGGNLTLVGSTPQIIAQGILTQTEGCEPMGFFDLTKGTVPLLIVMLAYYATFGYSLQRKVFSFPEAKDSDPEQEQVKSKKALICGVIFLWCIVGFIFNIFSIGTVAVIGACACIVTQCITIERAAETMDWTSILVLGGSMGLSKGLDKSGTLSMLADTILEILGSAATPHLVFAMFLILAAFMGNVMSHTGTTAILVPVAITVALELGINPTLYTIAIVIGCNLAFATPVSTPPITMTLSAGYRFSDYTIVGGVLNLLCIIVALITLPFFY